MGSESRLVIEAGALWLASSVCHAAACATSHQSSGLVVVVDACEQVIAATDGGTVAADNVAKPATDHRPVTAGNIRIAAADRCVAIGRIILPPAADRSIAAAGGVVIPTADRGIVAAGCVA